MSIDSYLEYVLMAQIGQSGNVMTVEYKFYFKPGLLGGEEANVRLVITLM